MRTSNLAKGTYFYVEKWVGFVLAILSMEMAGVVRMVRIVGKWVMNQMRRRISKWYKIQNIEIIIFISHGFTWK
jgi:hypothetical protein